MLRIPRDKITVVFDPNETPVARVQPGDTFVVETEDARSGRTRTPETCTPAAMREMQRVGWYGNPVTGPIHIEGAEPGDTLLVHIIRQEIDNLGWIPIWPHLFDLQEVLPEPVTRLVDIRDGLVELGDYRIPVRPMIGTIGVAPPKEVILSGGMGQHGGNVDVEEVCEGSTVILPVFVPGALLALGDCHAVQSDAELASVEIRSDVTVRVDLIKRNGSKFKGFRVVTPEKLVTVAVGRPLEEPLRAAFKEMIRWVAALTGLTTAEAYALVGIAGQARPGQSQVGLYSMRCIFPREHLPPGVNPLR